MNADDVVRYGHLTVLGVVEGLPIPDWERPNVCGVWSTREIIAHLASYELATVEVFASLLGEQEKPLLDRLLADPQGFNETEVARRHGQSAEQTLAEYTAAYEQADSLLAQIPVERRRQTGLLPWYGAEYDLEDLLAYMSYGHKREHSAQVAVFRDRLAGAAAG